MQLYYERISKGRVEIPQFTTRPYKEIRKFTRHLIIKLNLYIFMNRAQRSKEVAVDGMLLDDTSV